MTSCEPIRTSWTLRCMRSLNETCASWHALQKPLRARNNLNVRPSLQQKRDSCAQSRKGHKYSSTITNRATKNHRTISIEWSPKKHSQPRKVRQAHEPIPNDKHILCMHSTDSSTSEVHRDAMPQTRTLKKKETPKQRKTCYITRKQFPASEAVPKHEAMRYLQAMQQCEEVDLLVVTGGCIERRTHGQVPHLRAELLAVHGERRLLSSTGWALECEHQTLASTQRWARQLGHTHTQWATRWERQGARRWERCEVVAPCTTQGFHTKCPLANPEVWIGSAGSECIVQLRPPKIRTCRQAV